MSGSPTANSVSWLFSPLSGISKVLNTVENKISGRVNGYHSLTINNFQSTDAGTYTSQAENDSGTSASRRSFTTLTLLCLYINLYYSSIFLSSFSFPNANP